MIIENLDNAIFNFNSVLTCGDIEFSAWCNKGRNQLLALFLSRGEIILICFRDGPPIIRRVPWYKNAIHRPVAITFSPAGSYLLVLNANCNLFIVPALPMFDPHFKNDISLNASDITFIQYPFKNGAQRVKSNNTSGDTSIEANPKSKEKSGKLKESIGTSVTWHQTLEECQQIGIIGTRSGEIIQVDLVTGTELATANVRGEITKLKICIEDGLDAIFLLISTHTQQYRMTLEQRLDNRNRPNLSAGSEDGEDDPPKNYRARLSGFKQMSVETLANIKLKVAEARAFHRSGPNKQDQNAVQNLLPEPLESSLRDNVVTVQYSRGRHVLTGYHPSTQLLTVHSTSLDKNPLFVHKMPLDSSEFLLSDRIIYVLNHDRTQVTAVSSHLSESRMERDSEFNTESIVGCVVTGPDNDGAVKESVISMNVASATDNIMVLPDDWHIQQHSGVLHSFNKLMEESGSVESCIVVTTHQVVRLILSDHVMTTLRLVLDQHALMQAERLCKIFGINLSKILELAGDIDMARHKFPAAIARFKLANCGPLRITVKLARLGHCSELLSYSTALLTSTTATLSHTDHLHISNLLLMSFVHQILCTQSPHLKRKFLSFLETNDYYDKGLAMNLTSQSLLFSALQKLVITRGLIADGVAVLVNLINNFVHDTNLFTAAQDEEMWLCLSEPALQEAFVYRHELFLALTSFIALHLNELSPNILERLCRALDPSSPTLRTLVRLPLPEDNPSFPLDKMVQMFLNTLLILLSKRKLVYEKDVMLPMEQMEDTKEMHAKQEDDEDSDDQIWAVRKDRKDSLIDQCSDSVVSCGFGHTALIRNGAVMTWGMASKGCLGHGPALSRHASPQVISWFTSFRLQVSHVSCGKAHTIALTNNGVYGWGSSQLGQLGLGPVQESPHPRLLTSLTAHRIISAVCGQYHTLYLTTSGSVLATGWNIHGQLGIGTVENVRVPVLVHTLREHVVVDLAGGHGHSLVLTDTGHVYSFGSCIFGQLGNGGVVKSCVPVLVKGITGRVTQISTAYFHNLALTISNSLYTWGASPQVLRIQGQAHKRARAMQMAPSTSEDTGSEAVINEAHLKPSLVDTRNVSGRIVQMGCGCLHSALLTDSGSLYMWGRSMDGQLGSEARSEVTVPSLIMDGGLKASSIALGYDFSVAIEKNSGKLYAWGSNHSGQVGIPIVASKNNEGKIVVVKTMKRFVRLPNSAANVVCTPSEVPDIPAAMFTYQPLNSTIAEPAPPPPSAYTAHIWHHTLQRFITVVNPELLLCKCLELGNHQAASKILLLQGLIRQALVHQLKALQKAQKQKERSQGVDKARELREERSKKVVATPDSEIHPFTVQGGLEGMCDMIDPPVNGVDGATVSSPLHKVDVSLIEYTNTAQEILLRYLIHYPDNAADILETGIHFWTAQKLPISVLEAFLLEHLERVYYPLGCLLYIEKRDLARHFSAELELKVTTRLVAHVDMNGSCEEFLKVLTQLLSCDVNTTVADLSAKLQNPPKKNIHVTWPKCPGDHIYVFSCGHSKTTITLPDEMNHLAEAYSRLDTEGTVDMACPDCTCSVFAAEVA